MIFHDISHWLAEKLEPGIGIGKERTNREPKNQTLELPSGKHTKNDETSLFFMGKSTISMAIFQFANCQPLPGGYIPLVSH